MQSPVAISALRRLVITAASALALSAYAENASSDSAQAPNVISEGDHTTSLPVIVQALLAEALATEEKIKQRGPRQVIWLYAQPLCLSDPSSCPARFPLPTCLFEHGLCGAVNRDGSIAVAPRFDFVDEFQEGRALVRSGGLYGYVDLNDRLVVEPQYAIAGRYHLGYAEVDVAGKSALIDLDGRQILEPRFARAGAFTKDVFWVNDGERDFRGRPGGAIFASMEVDSGSTDIVFVRGKWGLIDAAGTWIRKPEFSAIAVFDPDKDDLMWAKAAAGWGLIRPDGTWFLEPTFQSIVGVFQGNGRLIDDRAPVMMGRRAGFIDHTGRVVIAPSFDYAQHFVDGLPAPVMVGGMEGLIDRAGAWVAEPIYRSIIPIFSDGTNPEAASAFKGFLAKRGETYSILDQSGKTIISNLMIDHRVFGGSTTSAVETADFPLFCSDGRIIGVVDKKPRMFTRDGTPMLPPQGELWWPLSCNAPFAVKIGDQFGYLDENLRLLVAAKFETVGRFSNGLAAVKLGGNFGVIRTDGTWAIEPNFDVAQPLPGEKALVKVGGRAAIVDLSTGRPVTPARFDDVCFLGRGVVGVVVEGKMGAIDISGHWLFDAKYQPWAFNFFQDLAEVQWDDKWGFVDAAGNSIEAKFDEVRRFERGVEIGRAHV
jgi:hypothetical protein